VRVCGSKKCVCESVNFYLTLCIRKKAEFQSTNNEHCTSAQIIEGPRELKLGLLEFKAFEGGVERGGGIRVAVRGAALA